MFVSAWLRCQHVLFLKKFPQQPVRPACVSSLTNWFRFAADCGQRGFSFQGKERCVCDADTCSLIPALSVFLSGLLW